jgi:hypothetical protein
VKTKTQITVLVDTDHVSVRSSNFYENLIGDYRGIEMARVCYIPGVPESLSRAKEVAGMIAETLEANL